MPATHFLSQSQLGVYTTPHVVLRYFALPKGIDVPRLAAAVDAVIAIHPLLMAHLVMTEEGLPAWEEPTGELFYTPIVEAAGFQEAQTHIGRHFALKGERLFRIAIYCTPEGDYLFLCLHHLIYDGFSETVFVHDLECAYRGEPLAPEEVDAFTIAEREAAERKTPFYEEAKAWYQDTFGGEHSDRWMLNDGMEESAYGRLLEPLTVNTECVETLCRQCGVKASTVYSAAFALTLGMFTYQERVLFTTVWHGRRDKDTRRTMTMMVKTLPMLFDLSGTLTVKDLLRGAAEQTRLARHYSVYSFADLHHDLGIGTEVTFAYHGTLRAPDLHLEGYAIPMTEVMPPTPGLTFLTMVLEKNDGPWIWLDYPQDRFSEPFVRRFKHTYEQVLEALTQHSEACLQDIGERLTLSAEGLPLAGNDKEHIVNLFRKVAATYPDRTAVLCKNQRLTYRDLDEQSERLALSDRWEGAQIVPLELERSAQMVVEILAVLKKGRAYMPIDPHIPKERKQIMKSDGVAASEEQGLFAVLYTSGSTGKPKGVMITEEAILNFCRWYRDYYALQPSDCVAAYSNVGFDACMMDLFPALTTGASVCIVPEEIRLDIRALNDCFLSNGVTHAFMTTQLGLLFIQSTTHTSLKHLTIGGERLTVSAERLALNCCTVHHAYGPTECTIFSTIHRVTPNEEHISIGKPIYGLQAIVADRFNHPVPTGAIGELILYGPQVSRGYLNQPERTAERFFEIDGIRAYRTGDLVQVREDGQIDFVGRKDRQIKLRGFRIEPEEVERVIAAHPAVREVVCVPKQLGASSCLCLYYTQRVTVNGESLAVSGAELKAHAAQMLPSYMVPDVFMQLEAMPVGANGKTDHTRLPEPELPDEHDELPATDMEQRICRVFCELLRTPSIGVTTDLRSVGLNSILAMQAVARLSKEQLPIEVTALLKHHSVRDIAAYMEQHTSQPSSHRVSHPVQAVYPVLQTTATYMTDFQAGKPTFSLLAALRIEGTELDEMERALDAVFEAYPSLKVRTEYQNGKAVMLRDDSARIPVAKHQVNVELSTDEVLTCCEQPVTIVGGFLGRYALVQTPRYGYLVLHCSHAILDGFSLKMLVHAFCMALHGEALTPEYYTVYDFALDEQRYLHSEALRHDEDHYRQWTGDRIENVLPFDDKPEDEEGYAETVRVTLDKAMIDRYCLMHNVRQGSFFASLYMQAFGHAGGWKDVMLSSLHSNRSTADLASLMSMTMRNYPLVSRRVLALTDTDFEQAAWQDIQQVEQQVNEALQISFYDYYGANGLGRKSPTIADKSAFVYYVGLTEQLFPPADEAALLGRDVQLFLRDADRGDKREKALEPLVCYIHSDEQSLYELTLKYNHHCYHTATIERIAAYIRTFVARLVDDTYPVPKSLEPYMQGYRLDISHGIRVDHATLAQMEQALMAVFEANPSLMMRTAYRNGQAVMRHAAPEEMLVTKRVVDREPDFVWISRHCFVDIDIMTGPPAQFILIEGPQYSYFVFHGSHGVMDSSGLLLLMEAFRQALRGELLTPERYTVFDYTLDEQRYLHSAMRQEEEAYFRALVGDRIENVLPFDDEPEDEEGYAETVKVRVDQATVQRFCEQHHIRHSNFFAGIYMQAFGIAGGWKDVMIAGLHSNRSSADLEGMMSLTMRTYPLVSKRVVAFSDNDYKEAVLTEMRQIEAQVDRAKTMRFYDYYGAEGLGHNSPNRNTKSAFLYYSGLMEQLMHNSITLPYRRQKTDEPLVCHVDKDQHGHYEITLKYNHRCYHTATIERIAQLLRKILSLICNENPIS